MVINFICRASKADKSGQSPLEVSIIINGVRRLSTPTLSKPLLDKEIKPTLISIGLSTSMTKMSLRRLRKS